MRLFCLRTFVRFETMICPSIRFVMNLQIFKKPEIGITNWRKEILGLEFTFCHFVRENVPLALGGYFSLERREKSCWLLITFQDTFLQIVKAHESRASLRTFFAYPFVHTFYFPSLLQVNYRTTLQYTQLCFWNRIHLLSTRSLCVLSVLDLEECTTGSHSCDVNSVCQSTVGSYTCSGNAGYTGDGKSCNGILQTVEPPCDTTSIPTHKWRWSNKYHNFEISYNKLFKKNRTFRDLNTRKRHLLSDSNKRLSPVSDH